VEDAGPVLAFTCPTCGSPLFFDSSSCLGCGTVLAYDASAATFQDARDRRLCVNRDAIGCNWLAGAGLCAACALTRTRPSDTDPAGLAAWAAVEAAKRMLVFQLDQLGLPLTGTPALVFDLLSSAAGPVTTGHADGTITIDLAEGADPHRERLRVSLAEPYRTVLGHLRHEVGHYYWARLIDGTTALHGFRALFGDERADYSQALSAHYDKPDDRGWTGTHISRYAAAHPWEDWAETFAHYLHIQDTLQTARAWRVTAAGTPPAPGTDFDEVASTWVALSTALNAINRSMGRDDLYPFVLSTDVLAKLRFVHHTVEATRTDR
jgi:hypothetical protein